jgi:hypothetical protein
MGDMQLTYGGGQWSKSRIVGQIYVTVTGEGRWLRVEVKVGYYIVLMKKILRLNCRQRLSLCLLEVNG